MYTKQFTYDTDGRLYTANVGGNTSVYTWSEDSRLTHIDLPGTTNDPSYAYNGVGTRVSKTVSSTTSSWKRAGAGVTSPVIADSGATYVPGVSERRGSTTTYAHSGILNEYAQSSGATLAATSTYDAFGAKTASTGSWAGSHDFCSRFGYQNEVDTSLMLVGNRYYDASLGRFLSRDPIKDGNNWYSYCGGSPVRQVDPTGLFAWYDLLPSDEEAEFRAGWGDSLSEGGLLDGILPGNGLSAGIRSLIGCDDQVDTGSGWYHGGQVVAEVHKAAMVPGGIGKSIGAKLVVRSMMSAEAEEGLVVVIGRSMKDRIIPTARRIGGFEIGDWMRDWTLRKNAAWILGRIFDSDCVIIDIGTGGKGFSVPYAVEWIATRLFL